jgi:N6-adenosine-specific RNA methylase IME4
MSIADIKAFPQPRMEPDSLLFLWRVASMVEEAYEVVRAWGFVPKSEIVWEKMTVHEKDHFGMGRIVRAAHETCIVATRGRPKIESKSIRSRFAAPVGRHSQKPDEFFQLVQQLSFGPYVYTFSREPRKGWHVFGDELLRASP